MTSLNLKVQPAEAKIQPASWLWAGYLTPGSITLLHGTPRSGKSTLAAALLACLPRGGELAKRRVRQARALVVSEDSAEQGRLSTPGFDFHSQVCWMCRPARGRLPEGGLIQHIRDLVRVFAFDLVVIDPLAAFVPADTLAPLRQLTAGGAALLLVHDDQSAPGSPPHLTAHADIVIELSSIGKLTRQRRLTASSRFADAPPSLVLELNKAGTAYRVQEEVRAPARAAGTPRRRRGAG